MPPSDVPRHVPVLHTMVFDVCSPVPGETVIDVTLGLGGHAAEFLKATSPDGTLIGIDADPRNLALARAHLEPWADRIDLRRDTFQNLKSMRLPPVDILFADLGLSSPHLDDPVRGFTFRAAAPLDMRFNAEAGETAAELVERSTPEELQWIFQEYGELPRSKTLAEELAGTKVQTTSALVAACERVYGWRAKRFLSQVFQALRIAVNDEMRALEVLLREGPLLLKPGGRMAVLSYHSLEDRAVKHVFRALTTPDKDPVTGKALQQPLFTLLTPKALRPSPEEIRQNSRSRSALLRAIRRSRGHP